MGDEMIIADLPLIAQDLLARDALTMTEIDTLASMQNAGRIFDCIHANASVRVRYSDEFLAWLDAFSARIEADK
jgi:hypothetical protein